MDEAWVWDGDPDKDGWYAVLICWEPREGAFPDAHEWRSGEWVYPRYPVSGFHGPFASVKEAQQYASDNDPDM